MLCGDERKIKKPRGSGNWRRGGSRSKKKKRKIDLLGTRNSGVATMRETREAAVVGVGGSVSGVEAAVVPMRAVQASADAPPLRSLPLLPSTERRHRRRGKGGGVVAGVAAAVRSVTASVASLELLELVVADDEGNYLGVEKGDGVGAGGALLMAGMEEEVYEEKKDDDDGGGGGIGEGVRRGHARRGGGGWNMRRREEEEEEEEDGGKDERGRGVDREAAVSHPRPLIRRIRRPLPPPPLPRALPPRLLRPRPRHLRLTLLLSHPPGRLLRSWL